MAENDNRRSINLSVAACDPVGAACELLQLIRTHADETERGRKLATPVVEALRRSGLMSMGVPAVRARRLTFARNVRIDAACDCRK